MFPLTTKSSTSGHCLLWNQPTPQIWLCFVPKVLGVTNKVTTTASKIIQKKMMVFGEKRNKFWIYY